MTTQDGQDEQDILELTTGVKLKLKKPSPMIAAQAMRQAGEREPKPPTVFIQDKGREEENPNDPDYILAKRAWMADAALRCLRALIPTGTEINFIPEGFVGPEHEDFPDLMESMGMEAPTGKYTRYVDWVLYVACGPEDIETLSTTMTRRLGVREEDVAEAQELFQGLTLRRTDKQSPSGGGGGDRDQLPVADRGDGA